MATMLLSLACFAFCGAQDDNVLSDVQSFPLPQGGDIHVAFNSTGSHLLVGGSRPPLAIADRKVLELEKKFRANVQLLDTERATAPLLALQWSAKGPFCVALDSDKFMRVWQVDGDRLKAGKPLGVNRYQVHQGLGEYVAVSVHPGGEMLVSMDKRGVVSLKNSAGVLLPGMLVDTYPRFFHFSRDGSMWCTGTEERLEVFQFESKEDRQKRYSKREKSKPFASLQLAAPIDGMCWGPPEKRTELAVFSGSRMHLWNVDPRGAARRELLTASAESKAQVTAACFFPDGERLVAGYSDGKLVVWNTRTCRPIAEKILSSGIVSLDVSSDGGALAVGCRDGKFSIFWISKAKAVQQGSK